MLVIILFILILNIVSILLMYRCLTGFEKKERLIFVAAGTAIMYVLTSIVYWISTRNIEITEVAQTGKDLIIFAFVPINGILILPIFAKSFSKFKNGSLDGRVLKNRGIVLGAILIILLILEGIYFKNIQEQVVNLLLNQENIQNEQQENASNADALEDLDSLNSIDTNSVNTIENQIVVNDVGNENIVEENEINTNTENNIANEISGNVSSNIINSVINTNTTEE